jgi:hypothetical protein
MECKKKEQATNEIILLTSCLTAIALLVRSLPAGPARWCVALQVRWCACSGCPEPLALRYARVRV